MWKILRINCFKTWKKYIFLNNIGQSLKTHFLFLFLFLTLFSFLQFLVRPGHTETKFYSLQNCTGTLTLSWRVGCCTDESSLIKSITHMRVRNQKRWWGYNKSRGKLSRKVSRDSHQSQSTDETCFSAQVKINWSFIEVAFFVCLFCLLCSLSEGAKFLHRELLTTWANTVNEKIKETQWCQSRFKKKDAQLKIWEFKQTNLDRFCRPRSVSVPLDTCNKNSPWCYSREPRSLLWFPHIRSHLSEKDATKFISHTLKPLWLKGLTKHASWFKKQFIAPKQNKRFWS